MCSHVYVLQRPYKTDGGDGNEGSQMEKKKPDREIYGYVVQSVLSVSEPGWQTKVWVEDSD